MLSLFSVSQTASWKTLWVHLTGQTCHMSAQQPGKLEKQETGIYISIIRGKLSSTKTDKTGSPQTQGSDAR